MAQRHVKEGLVELELPEDARLDLKKGPQRAGGRMVFYNPAARTSRDLTVAVLRTLEPPDGGWRVLDGLCGSGVRGLRVAREVEHVREVVLNDGDEKAADLARSQALRLGLENVKVTSRSLDEALADSSTRFEFIDIDPYGSPARFLTAAASRASRPGYVAVTATDVAALCGVFPGACIRRYGAAPLRNEWMKETAARILLGAAARRAGAAERAVEPVATLSTDHYIRLIYRVLKGRRFADLSARSLGFLKLDKAGLKAPQSIPFGRLQEEGNVLEGPGPIAGPLWLGDLHDAALLARVKPPEWIADNRALAHFLAVAPGESALPPFHYKLDEVARRLLGSPPSTARAVEALKSAGFAAAPTHFDRKAVKSDASPSELLEALRPFVPRA